MTVARCQRWPCHIWCFQHRTPVCCSSSPLPHRPRSALRTPHSIHYKWQFYFLQNKTTVLIGGFYLFFFSGQYTFSMLPCIIKVEKRLSYLTQGFSKIFTQGPDKSKIPCTSTVQSKKEIFSPPFKGTVGERDRRKEWEVTPSTFRTMWLVRGKPTDVGIGNSTWNHNWWQNSRMTWRVQCLIRL